MKNLKAIKLTKKDMVKFLTNEISDCGHNYYFGYRMTDAAFTKKLMRLSINEVANRLHNHSDACQNFLKQDSRYE
jgi:hypothetical protein